MSGFNTPAPNLPPAPYFKDPLVKEYLDTLTRAISREIELRMVKAQPVDQLFLRSPSGKVYEVKVDDAGALSTVLVWG